MNSVSGPPKTTIRAQNSTSRPEPPKSLTIMRQEGIQAFPQGAGPSSSNNPTPNAAFRTPITIHNAGTNETMTETPTITNKHKKTMMALLDEQDSCKISVALYDLRKKINNDSAFRALLISGSLNDQGECILSLAVKADNCYLTMKLLGKIQDLTTKEKKTVEAPQEKKKIAQRIQHQLDALQLKEKINPKKQNALFLASMLGDAEFIKEIVKENTDINVRTAVDKNGRTALHYATVNNNNVVEFLINHYQMDIHQLDKWGQKHFSMVCSSVHKTIAECLVTKGANIHQAGNGGTPPLHVACKKGHTATAKLLIDNGAKVNQAMNDGATPLYLACYNGHKKTAELLLAKNADVNQVNNDGATPLFVAAQNDHTEVVKHLLENQAKVNQADKYGQTPLHIPCYNGHTATAELLLSKNADVNQAMHMGQTPLYVACYNGHTATAKLLIDNGAEVNKANNNGCTPLYVACEKGHPDIVQILFDNGADPKTFIKQEFFTNPFTRQYKNFSDDVKKVITEICTDKAIELRDKKLKNATNN
jgi:ankyrin repeat protein